MRRRVVAVIGASKPSSEERELARLVGQRLAGDGWVVATGGLEGVMEAAAEGARSAGGTVLGIVPQADPDACNEHVEFSIATGAGDARNAILSNTADAFIAVGGGLGTLSEIAFALKRGKPVVGLATWALDRSRLGKVSWLEVSSAEEAVEKVRTALRGNDG